MNNTTQKRHISDPVPSIEMTGQDFFKPASGHYYFPEDDMLPADLRRQVQKSLRRQAKQKSVSHKHTARNEDAYFHESRTFDPALISILAETKLNFEWVLVDHELNHANMRKDLTEVQSIFFGYHFDHADIWKGTTEPTVQTSTSNEPETYFDHDVDYDEPLFVPSPRLVSIWLDGLNSTRVEAGKALHTIKTREDFEAFSKELVRSIDTVIGNYAKLKSREVRKYHMTIMGRILTPIQTLLVEELLVPPLYSSDFLVELQKLLVQQTRTNVRFSGRWGELKIDDRNELVFDMPRTKRRTLAQVFRE